MPHKHTFRKEGKNTTPCGQSEIRNYITAIMNEQSCLLTNLASANVEKEIDVLDTIYGWILTCWATITKKLLPNITLYTSWKGQKLYMATL
jgi:hypothetical protein